MVLAGRRVARGCRGGHGLFHRPRPVLPPLAVCSAPDDRRSGGRERDRVRAVRPRASARVPYRPAAWCAGERAAVTSALRPRLPLRRRLRPGVGRANPPDRPPRTHHPRLGERRPATGAPHRADVHGSRGERWRHSPTEVRLPAEHAALEPPAADDPAGLVRTGGGVHRVRAGLLLAGAVRGLARAAAPSRHSQAGGGQPRRPRRCDRQPGGKAGRVQRPGERFQRDGRADRGSSHRAEASDRGHFPTNSARR